MIRRLLNKILYRRVYCRNCGCEVGYVHRSGHRLWLCPDCSEGGQPQPLSGPHGA